VTYLEIYWNLPLGNLDASRRVRRRISLAGGRPRSAGRGAARRPRRSGQRRWPWRPGREGTEQDTESAAPRTR